MRSLIGSLVNRSPVPLSPVRQRGTFTRLFGGSTLPGDEVLKAPSSIGTIFAIVNKLCTAVAKAEWTLYSSSASGLKEDRTPFTRKHAVIDLWNKPNPKMQRRRFMEAAQQHVELLGENAMITSFLPVGQGKKIPVELWPVKPNRIEVVPDPYDFIKGYVYTAPGSGDKMPLDFDELQRVMMPNPYDPYRGLGPAQAIMIDAQNIQSARDWNRAFFDNSAEPGGVIQVPVALNDTEFSRLQSQWREDHQGVHKAHRVAILENDAKWQGTSFTHRDMQFTELRHLGRDAILEAWGMPKSAIGIVEDVNRANAEAMIYVVALMAEERLDRWRDWLNFDLLPLYGSTGQGLEWDYESPVPKNNEADNQAIDVKSKALALLADKGFDAAEVAEWLEMPEMGYERPAPPTPPKIGVPDDSAAA